MKKSLIFMLSIVCVFFTVFFLNCGFTEEKPLMVISGVECIDGSPRELHVFFACVDNGFDHMTEGYVIACGDTVYCGDIYEGLKPNNIGIILPGESVTIEINNY